MDKSSAALANPSPAGSTAARSLRIGYICAALGAFLFATKAIVIKLAYAEGVTAETLLALRMALSLPIYGVIGALAVRETRGRGEALPDLRLAGWAGLIGMIGYWFASYTDFLGLQYISAQFERLILFTYPGFVVLFGALFFHQPVRRKALFAFAISYLGLAVIFLSDFGASGINAARGAALVLASAIAFALYQLLAKQTIARMGPRLFTCIAMSAAAIPVLIQFALTQPLDSLLVSPRMLGYGVLLAIGATVLPSFLLNMALQRISAQANSTIATLSPVVTIVLAVLLLGETMTGPELVGALFVLVGVGWFTLADRR